MSEVASNCQTPVVPSNILNKLDISVSNNTDVTPHAHHAHPNSFRLTVFQTGSYFRSGLQSVTFEDNKGSFFHWHASNRQRQNTEALEEASTHTSTTTHVGNVYVPFDFKPLNPKYTCFQERWGNISLSSLVILTASGFEILCGKKDRQTDRQTNTQTPLKTLPIQLPLAWANTNTLFMRNITNRPYPFLINRVLKKELVLHSQ